jgi:hypothetical protein
MVSTGQIRIDVNDRATEKLAELRHELIRWQVNLGRVKADIVNRAPKDAPDELLRIQIQEDLITDVLDKLND